MNKRKGQDFDALTSRSVVFSPPPRRVLGTSPQTAFCKVVSSRQRLAALRQSLGQQDSFILPTTRHAFEQAAQKQTTRGHALVKKVETLLEQALAAQQEESLATHQLQVVVQELQAQQQMLAEKLAQNSHEQHELELETCAYQQEYSCTQTQDMMTCDWQVPRLRHQLSLYAASTGIKWDFAQEQVLAGEVAIPSRQALRRFSMDPNEMTHFEIANQLWNMMEGNV